MASPNTLFALFAVSNPKAMEQKLQNWGAPFPVLDYKVTESSWFLIAPNTVITRELSDSLGITDGSVSGGILLRVENYFGRANKDIWEWLAAKMDVPLVVVVPKAETPVAPKVEAPVERQSNV
jgi:hypothetical protein